MKINPSTWNYGAPWKARPGSFSADGRWIGFKITDWNKKSIAALSSAAKRPSDEAEAIAHLIEAAPELFDALDEAYQTALRERHAPRRWHYKAAAALARVKGTK